MSSVEQAKQYLPLTEATYYILLSLREPLHGYGIMQYVEEVTEGEVQIGPGTLYGALNKLNKENLIEQVKSKNDRRKNYTLTSLGENVVRLEYQRVYRLVERSKDVVATLGGNDNGKRE